MSSLPDLDGKIKACGDRVRSLKSQKADKVVYLWFWPFCFSYFVFPQALVDSSVKELLELKKKFKEESGTDWSPEALQKPSSDGTQSKPQNETVTPSGTVESLNALVKESGDKVRTLKANKAEKVWSIVTILCVRDFLILLPIGCNWCCCQRAPRF